MPLYVGHKLGPYEILAPIGAGGMGEVYKARDGRLDRIVAVKTSKEQFDERFEREARAVAALNHPHICHLYDVGPNYLVMEYVDGVPLKGPLPLDQALKYAAQICDALDAAHRKGITHRDLKPANILITKTAGIKLLDFGLAKIEKGNGPSEATRTMALTSEGQILGTLYYMSPEQLQGQEAGPASDIFSFGLVLYEMLTGKRAFDGSSQASVIAGILERPAPSVCNVAPPALDRVLKRCLEKDPENRWQNAKDLKAELEWIATSGGGEVRQPAKNRPSWLPWALAAGAVIIALSFVHFREMPTAPLAMRLPVATPEFRGIYSLAISPDGRTLVISASPRSGQGSYLYLRSLDSADFRALSGTVGSRTPFWSADGRSIGFFAGGNLKVISAAGGPVQTLCDSGLGHGGTWNRDDVILFGNTSTGQILRVSASGGACTPILKPESSSRNSFPVFLPDGRHFFFASSGGEDDAKAGVYIASLDDPAARRVLADRTSVIYAPPVPGGKLAHLLFLRESTLIAQPFDPVALEPIGDGFPVAGQASFSNTPPQVAAAASANGVLVYISNLGPEHQLTWFDRSGAEVSRIGQRAVSFRFSLSPDGNSVAVTRPDAGRRVLWLHDLARDVENRLTPPMQSLSSPVWSPDGLQIAFSRDPDLYLKNVSGGADERLVRNTNLKTPSDWSPDGRFLLYTEIDPKTKGDIWILSDPLNKYGQRKAIPFLRTPFSESQAQFSPDGHWVAYVSDEFGPGGVYIRPFPIPSGSNVQWQVSVSGRSDQPRWSRDGRELFYLDSVSFPQRILMARPIRAGPRPVAAVDAPKLLFAFRTDSLVPELNNFSYSPSPDGHRFLVSAYADQNAEATLNVLSNWQTFAKRGTTAP